MKSTWKPDDGASSAPDHRAELPDSAYAFPKQRKEPMTDASHVRNAIARFDQVKDVSDAEREQAFANLKAAAKHFGVEMTETKWQELGKKPRTAQKAGAKKSVKKVAEKTTSARKAAQRTG